MKVRKPDLCANLNAADTGITEPHFFNTTENICAMVRLRLQKEAGQLVVAHKVSPKPSTLHRKADDYVYAC